MPQNFTYKPELEANERRVTDFKIGAQLFYVITIVWIVQKSLYLSAIFHRKEAFSRPLHWFGHLTLSLNIPEFGYTALSILGIAISIYTIASRKVNIVLQISLLLILMMLNTLKLSLGYLEHVDHLFLLAHFFLISYRSQQLNTLYTKYFQLGLLFTYTLSGFLKVIAMVYKTFSSDDITWLHTKAMHYQTYLLYETMHKPIPAWLQSFTTLGVLPMLLIVTGIIVETMAMFFVFQYKMLRYYLLWLLAFHLLNYLFFEINFLYAGLTAICFLFPFSVFEKNPKLRG